MFGFVKKFLGKKAIPSATTAPTSAPSLKSKKPADSAAAAKATTGQYGTAVHAAKQAALKTPAGAEVINVSLMGVANLLPAELRPARAVGDLASVQISFPLRPILEQLTQGCVRVPFGQVRKLAPPEFFTVGSESDEKLIELPLQEILQQVQSHSLGRRKNQRTVSIPEEVTSLFSARTSAAGPGKAGGRAANKGNTTSFFTKDKAATSSPTPPANRAAEVAKNSLPPQAPAPARSRPSVHSPIDVAARTLPPEPAPAPVADSEPPVSKPIAAPRLSAAFQSHAAPVSTKATVPPASAPVMPSAAPTGELVNIPLSKISGAWPNEVQMEIVAWKLESASVALPTEEVIVALKAGKVQVSWSRLIASLVKGAGAGRTSAHGSVILDLPLQAVAPAFLAQRRSPGRAPRATVEQTIPDLFHAVSENAAAPTLEAVAAPVASAVVKPAGVPPAATSSTAAAPLTTASGSATLSVPLAMVDDAWPDSLRSEIARCQVQGVKLELPVEEVNRALKSGKIEYPWRQLRAWMVPALPPECGADFADKLIALPLKVIAPLFLGQVKALKTPKKTDTGIDIPELFSAAAPSNQGSEIAVGEASASRPAATGNGALKSSADAGSTGVTPSAFSTTQFFRKPPADLGELFGQPGKRNWTPQEIVQNTTRIRGVSGAVIAMQDGLMVAAQMPSPWKAEATAAFLPQIYSRLTQFLKELNTGDLISATLATPSGTLVVFNAGIIYFAVVGKVDEPIPLAPIKMIVDELSRHSK